MIRSMTGFAYATLNIERDSDRHATLAFALKSLNSRFFEANCKLPYPFSNLETDCIKILKDHLLRGYVQLSMHISNANALKNIAEPSLDAVKEYVTSLQRIQQTFQLPGTITLDHVIHMPALFAQEDLELSAELKTTILDRINTLISNVIVQQEREGKALGADIAERIHIMRNTIAQIEIAAQALMERKKIQIQHELTTLEQNQEQLLELRKNALYYVLDKIDIHEEIVRFKSHLQNVESILASSDIEKGKRLDFTIQELSRETNTIAAKCSDAAISSLAITIKVELEKIREQTQNIV